MFVIGSSCKAKAAGLVCTVQVLTGPDRLVVAPVTKQDHGMYQCFVSSDWDMAQATAELHLGGEYRPAQPTAHRPMLALGVCPSSVLTHIQPHSLKLSSMRQSK